MTGTNGVNGVAFDIDELRSTETAELAIVHPATGEPTSWIWTLAGPGHPKSVEAMNIATRETLRIARLREQAVANRGRWVEPERTPEQLREDNAKSFALRIVGWTPARINGGDYPFSYDNAVKLLLDPNFGRIYEQLLRYFLADDAFTKRSAPTSSPTRSESSSSAP